MKFLKKMFHKKKRRKRKKRSSSLHWTESFTMISALTMAKTQYC
jgi:hypothetical protein